MKKQLFGILILTLSMSICACNKSKPSSESSDSGSSSETTEESSGPQFEPFKTKTTVEMNASLSQSKMKYDLEFNYSDEYFLRDATTYDKELSELSFGAAYASTYARNGSIFFNATKFHNITAVSYDTEPTDESIAYFIAHKTIDDSELFAISIRGFEYQLEWADNFRIGKTGDHNGFGARANEIYERLQEYIEEHLDGKTLKLWIAGYSRAGAIANVLSNLILKGEEIVIEQKNMYVYTFEAPNCIDSTDLVAYQNVHNILNQNDIITSIPPTSYNLGRCGVTYEIYDENVRDIVRSFDESIPFPEFVTIDIAEPITKDSELVSYVLGYIFNNQSESEDVKANTANTREEYADRYQEGLSYMIGLAFSLPSSTLNSIVNDISGRGMGAISLLGDETGEELANVFKQYLDRDNISYDNEKLVSSCAVLRNGIMYLFLPLILIYMNTDYRQSLTRLIYMHYPESTYALLLNAHKK